MERKVFLTIFAVITAVVCIVLCVIQSAYGEDLYILCRPDSKVNIRSKPRKNSAVNAWIECGQCVHTDGKVKNGFVHVVGLPAEITEGWIYAGYLVDEPPAIRTYLAEVWEGDVIARSSVNGKRLQKLREGRTVTVYAKTHMWAVTNKGFIMCDWLREIEQ
jgi:hypothetical protein